MKKMYCFRISSSLSMEKAWEILEEAGVELAYGEVDDNGSNIYIFEPVPDNLTDFPFIESAEPYTLPEIDWASQWAMHGLDYRDGLVHVKMQQFNRGDMVLKLEPGPGFGDLSHPTTLLVLELMGKYLSDEIVIDIGCGSGVLTLSALAMGAQEAIGIDIDVSALEHSRLNAKRNGMESQAKFLLPIEFQPLLGHHSNLITMNMIYSEQLVAWESMPILATLNGKRLISGIRTEEKDHYLELAFSWGWKLQDTIERDGWVGFYFLLT